MRERFEDASDGRAHVMIHRRTMRSPQRAIPEEAGVEDFVAQGHAESKLSPNPQGARRGHRSSAMMGDGTPTPPLLPKADVGLLA